jgi:DNA helicase II / ATP-dependent DNA helicase PcrA
MAVDLSHLNPEQREAASHFTGPMLVLAGAGSGKTRVLVTRITWLIEEQGVDPGSILALTFTNKAAGEMRERIRVLLGREPTGMWMGTFHAIGARMLRRDAVRLGWSPSFTVYDADDSEALIKRILKDELRLDVKKWSPRAVKSAISAAKNELTSPEEYAKNAADQFTRVVSDVYGRYQSALKNNDAFDFDDLLVKPVELLRRHEQVRERYRDRFQFVLVDEYQDTNRAQYVLLKLLVEGTEDENLFVVGDDDQSIYGWRGADIRNILDFEKDFPAARVVRLEENYRSTQTILDAANAVIAENVGRKGKTLRTANPSGEMVTLVEAADEGDEAEWVSDEIRARQADNPDLSLRDFVTLYRTNSQSRALEEALRRRGIPYRVVGGTRFYERREVKDALAYLRLVANPGADEAFLRIVNVPKRGIGDASVARLAEYASQQGISLLAAAERADLIEGIRGSAAKALPGLAGFIRKYAALAQRDVSLAEMLRDLVTESGMVQALRDEGPEGDERVANLEELIAGAADLQRRLETEDPELMAELEEIGNAAPRPIDLFLGHVALVADIDQHDPRSDAVTLMTLHNAKGLEFPFVFIAGLEDGLFPMARANDEPKEMEEERRLFYVGITRAERKLYLLHARRRRRGAQYMDSIPSRFLESVPRDLTEPRRTTRTLERTPSWSQPWKFVSPELTSRSQRLFSRPTLPKRSEEDPSYQVDYSDSQDAPQIVKGARVRHPQFGSGRVAEISGAGRDVRATIDFDSAGRKTVVLRFANLERDWDE